MNNLLYCVLDRQSCLRECIASIKSLEKVSANELCNTKITIYTNLIEDFKVLLSTPISIPIEFRHITAEQRIDWVGIKPYPYRAKICTLIDFLESGEESAILIDTDTFFLKESDGLFKKLLKNGTVIMNYPEYSLQHICFKPSINNHRFFLDLMQEKGITVNGKTFACDGSTLFWNSGIIGVTKNALGALCDALILCDTIQENYRLFTSEQIALSFILGQQYNIASGDDTIYHYWFMKEARYFIEAALNIPIDFETKYRNTNVVEYLKTSNSKMEFELLPDLIREQLLKMNYRYITNIYKIINEDTHLGRMLRA